MLKIVGAAIIISTCGYAGIIKGKRYAQRPDQIRKLRSALQSLETEIAWMSTPLPEALEKVSKIAGQPVNILFSTASETMKKKPSLSAGECWESAIKNARNYLALNNQEMEILQSFGLGLGNSHKEEQIKNLSLAREHLKSIELEAETDKKRYEKLYRTMGFLVGITITLILI